MNMEEKMSMDLAPPPEHLCYVRCNFCNTVLALYSCERPSIRETISKYKVVIPYKRLMETVTVKCGHCGNVSFLSTRPPLQGQCLDRQITLQGYNFLEKPGGFCNSIDHHINKKVQPSSSSSSASTQPDSPRPFVVKPPEKKHRLPSAYNRFMKEEIQRIKAANPEIAHREAFSTAAKNWARFLPHSPAGSLAGSSKIN